MVDEELSSAAGSTAAPAPRCYQRRDGGQSCGVHAAGTARRVRAREHAVERI